jgi:hypothetical protein
MTTSAVLWCVLSLFLSLAAPAPARAEILPETGTLRGFLAGDCPGCAYDNWISHITEGVARPGYNAYAPPVLDPQLSGFGGFQLVPAGGAGDSLLTLFRDLATLLLDNQGEAAALRLEESPAAGYELAQLTDSSLARSFWLLREPLDSTFVDPGLSPGPQDDVVGGFSRGWGVFVVNPSATRPELCVQMPHPCDDFPTPYLGLEAFLELDAGLLMIHGAGREVAYTGPAASYTNSVSLSDPSRNCRLPYAAVHEAFLAHERGLGRRELVLQLHSYDDASHRNLTYSVVTTGPSNRLHFPPLFDTGGGDKGLLGNLGQPVLAADALGWPHPALRLQDYVSSNSQHALWLATGLPDSLVQLPAAGALPGYGANCQLTASYGASYPECDQLERILHVEVDELPAPVHALGAAAFYGCTADTLVAGLAQFAGAWTAFRPFVVALRTARDSLMDFQDSAAPTPPTGLAALQSGSGTARLSWQPTRSVLFDTYELWADTALVIGPGARVVTRSQLATLCYPALRTADLTGLAPGQAVSLALRARDDQGRLSEFSGTVRLFVADLEAPVVVAELRRVVPAGEPAAIRATVTDSSPLAAVLLRHSPDNQSWTDVAMVPLGAGVHEGWLPVMEAGDSLWCQVCAEDDPAARSVACSAAWRVVARERVAAWSFDGEESATHESFGGGSDQWRRESCAARAGAAWRFGGPACAPYGAGGAGWLNLEALVVPDGLLQPTLSLWMRMDAEVSSQRPDSCYDGGLFQLQAPGGEWCDAASLPAPTHALKRSSTVPLGWPRRMFSGSSAWQELLVALPEGADTVRLRAGFVCDGAVHKAGMALDDVALWGLLPAVPPAPRLELGWLGDQLALTWRPVAGATAYLVEAAGTCAPDWSTLATTPECRWILDSAALEPVVRLRVVALR